MVKVVNKIQYLLFEIRLRRKTASSQEFACQNAEPDFNLIEPGPVLWGEMKNHLVLWISEKLGAGAH